MKKSWIGILLCVALSAGMTAGCSPRQSMGDVEQTEPSVQTDASAQAEGGGVILTDMQGHEVRVEQVKRAISLTPAGTEIICALGGEALLVGIDAFSNYPEGTKEIEIVGDYNGPDVEKVVALEPDVIFAGNTLQQDAIDQLESLGMTVVCIEATGWEEVPVSIALVGEVLDAQQEAEAVIGELEAAEKAAQEAAPKEKPTVYYAVSFGDSGNWTSGPGSFINTMIEIAGGSCVTEDAADSWVEFPIEDLVVADPDIILLDNSMGSTGDLATVPGYQELSAIAVGRVYGINADVFTRPGPRLAEAIAQLSDIINGKAA